jgi:hypothetical protein
MRNAETYLILVGLIVLVAFSVVFAAAEMSYIIRSSMSSLGTSLLKHIALEASIP